MPTCPRCTDTSQAPLALEAHETHGVPFEACPGCEGVLIAQRKLVPMLESMIQSWGHEIDPDHHIEAVSDAEVDVACPSCRSPMTRFGYMGMDLVQLDRCSACELLWTDAEELAVVSVLFARTRRRTTMRQQQREDAYRERDRRFSIMMQRQRIRGHLGLRGQIIEGVLEAITEL